jgi:hypothetical protein
LTLTVLNSTQGGDFLPLPDYQSLHRDWFWSNPDSDFCCYDLNFQSAKNKKILQRRIRFRPKLWLIFLHTRVHYKRIPEIVNDFFEPCKEYISSSNLRYAQTFWHRGNKAG